MIFHHPKKVGRKDFARFFQRFFYMCVWLAERSRLLVRMCNFICAMVKVVAILEMGIIPPLIGILIMGI